MQKSVYTKNVSHQKATVYHAIRLITFCFVFLNTSTGQVIGIYSFEQNQRTSLNVNNLILNGGFEIGCTVPFPFCPDALGPNCNFQNWLCTGGGPNTYAKVVLSNVEGIQAPYFGNAYCRVCPPNTNTCLLINYGNIVTGIPAGYPTHSAEYGGTSGVNLEQTVSGLSPGNIYVLEFWAGGETYGEGRGVFAVDVGFGKSFLREPSTDPILAPPLPDQPSDTIGTRFIIEFIAQSVSQTIRFTNWGHISIDNTELIIDDVLLYPIAELDSSVPRADTAVHITVFGHENPCPGGCTYLATLSYAGHPPYTYTWSPDIGSGSGPYQVCPESTTVYTVTITDANNNTSSATITIHPDGVASPPVNISLLSIAQPSCGHNNGSINVQASGGTPPHTYLWNNVPPNTYSNLFNLQPGTYSVTAKDFYGCSSMASYIINPSSTDFLIVSPDVSICPGESTILTASGGSTYKWFPASGLSSTTAATVTASPAATTTYRVISNNPGCTDTTYVTVTVNSLPVVSIAANNSNHCLANTIYFGYDLNGITLTANSPSATSYLWSTGETTQSISAITAGTYSVTVFDAIGCSSLQTQQSQIEINSVDIRCGQNFQKVVLCHVPEGNPGNPQTICISSFGIPAHLALHEYDCLGPCSWYYFNRSDFTVKENSIVYVYPNPFSNGFNLTILTVSSNTVTVNIHDMLGQVVETYSNVTEETLMGTKLTAGIYFAEIVQDGNRQKIQIVKSE